MKKKVFVIVLVIFTLFILSKIYHFIIVNNMRDAVKEFRNHENRYYLVSLVEDNKIVREEEILAKSGIVKYISNIENIGRYCEWKNFETNEQYSFNLDKKKLYKGHILIEFQTLLPNVPDFISVLYKEDNFNMSELFNVHYIIPTKYNDKDCYKIVTKNETIIIDKNTYLPVYSAIKTVNSDKGTKSITEYTYKFEIDSVTDEDIALPDLSQYEVVEKIIE